MKESFVLHTHQQEAFNQLTNEQAGVLIKSIFTYQATGALPQFKESSLAIAFGFIKHSLDVNQQKYEEICAKRAQSGRKGGKAPKSKCLPSKNQTTPSKAKHTDTDTETGTDTENDNNISLTAQARPAQGKKEISLQEKKIPLPAEFVDQVLARFEESVQTSQQRRIFVKNNASNLKDILEFCDHNIPLALQTISVCVRRLQQGGVTGGYAAVCRNLPEYYDKAKKELEEATYD